MSLPKRKKAKTTVDNGIITRDLYRSLGFASRTDAVEWLSVHPQMERLSAFVDVTQPATSDVCFPGRHVTATKSGPGGMKVSFFGGFGSVLYSGLTENMALCLPGLSTLCREGYGLEFPDTDSLLQCVVFVEGLSMDDKWSILAEILSREEFGQYVPEIMKCLAVCPRKSGCRITEIICESLIWSS